MTGICYRCNLLSPEIYWLPGTPNSVIWMHSFNCPIIIIITIQGDIQGTIANAMIPTICYVRFDCTNNCYEKAK